METSLLPALRTLWDEWVAEMVFWIGVEGDEARGRVKALEYALDSLHAAVFNHVTATPEASGL